LGGRTPQAGAAEEDTCLSAGEAGEPINKNTYRRVAEKKEFTTNVTEVGEIWSKGRDESINEANEPGIFDYAKKDIE
jgi:hypothetical protein